VIEAVLFDWNNTLTQFTWDDDLVVLAHRAALGRDDPAFTAAWREAVLGDAPKRPYAEILRELGVEDTDAFIDAEHAVWRPAFGVLESAQALLDSLRRRGIKTGIVANSWPDPGRVLREDVESYGLTSLLDVIVFSDDLGVSKPAPEIFLHALRTIGVEPEAAMYVGDGLVNDVQGAARVGMTTVQALWFVADQTPVGVEPDFMAFTPMDVLNAVRRVAL
jgi:FMN phosphatase YigB (HAD superfamily)